MALAELKREARKLAKANGHTLGRWTRGDVLTMADCTRCGNTIFIDPDQATYLNPSEPISGSGVLTLCAGDTLAAALRDILDTRTIFTRTSYPGAYVRAYIADRDSIEEITWTIGRVLDETVSHRRGDTEHYGIKRGGYGYNRALDVLSDVARKVGTTFDQSRWIEQS